MGKRGTAHQRRKDMHEHLLALERDQKEKSAKKHKAAELKVKGDIVMGEKKRKTSKKKLQLKPRPVKLGVLEIKQKRQERQQARKESKLKAMKK